MTATESALTADQAADLAEIVAFPTRAGHLDTVIDNYQAWRDARDAEREARRKLCTSAWRTGLGYRRLARVLGLEDRLEIARAILYEGEHGERRPSRARNRRQSDQD